jgi:hypothetical protein
MSGSGRWSLDVAIEVYCARSSARFSNKTLMLGSPKIPHCGPSIRCCTSRRGADMRIQTAAGCRYQVDRDAQRVIRVGGLELSDARFDRLGARRVGRT